MLCQQKGTHLDPLGKPCLAQQMQIALISTLGLEGGKQRAEQGFIARVLMQETFD